MPLSSPCHFNPLLLSRGTIKGRRIRGDRTIRAEQPRQGDSGTESTESLFAKEVRKRGISKSTSRVGQTYKQETDDVGGSGAEQPPRLSKEQQEWAQRVNSDGFEGLVPRATELVKLGGSFFLAFAPFLIGVTVAAAIFFLVFGDAFIHGGVQGSGPPPYVDPDELLRMEAVGDPMVPLR